LNYFGSRKKIYIPGTGYKRYLHRAIRKHERFLSGLAVMAKVTIKFVLDFYKIPYTVVVGYKDMPVDALLGIRTCLNYLTKQVRSQFQESPFYKPEEYL
jgi:hypothetical protein